MGTPLRQARTQVKGLLKEVGHVLRKVGSFVAILCFWIRAEITCPAIIPNLFVVKCRGGGTN